jgi:cytochrome c556
MRIRSILTAGVLGAALGAASFGPALAGEGAAAIAERQALMKLIGGNMSALKLAIDSKDAARLKQVEGNARAIAAAGGAIPTMFPKGSDSKAGKTAALPAIWDKAADFKKASEALSTEATALAEAVKAGDAAKAASQFGRLGSVGCGGCHNTYRAKQN